MKRLGYMVHVGCFPTREGAEAKKKVMDMKGVNSYIEDVDALTMRELVTAIMSIEQRLEETNRMLEGIMGAKKTDEDSGAGAIANNITKKTQEESLAGKFRIRSLPSDFGVQVLNHALKKNYRLQDIAFAAGCSFSTVTRAILQNEKSPSPNLMAKIALAVGIPFDNINEMIAKDTGGGTVNAEPNP